MKCKALACAKDAGDEVLCLYHQEKFRIATQYAPEVVLNWLGGGIVSILLDGWDEIFWDEILTLDELVDSLYISGADHKPVMCNLVDGHHWFSTPLETQYIRYGTLGNWVQEKANFDEVRMLLEDHGYLVTDRGGQGHYEEVETWKAGGWSKEEL